MKNSLTQYANVCSGSPTPAPATVSGQCAVAYKNCPDQLMCFSRRGQGDRRTRQQQPLENHTTKELQGVHASKSRALFATSSYSKTRPNQQKADHNHDNHALRKVVTGWQQARKLGVYAPKSTSFQVICECDRSCLMDKRVHLGLFAFSVRVN